MAAPLEIQLGRLDIASTSSSKRHCLVLLPSSKGKRQKLVTGDDSGVVASYGVKKGVTEVVFKNAPGRRDVTSLALGGPFGDKDRIYAAFGQTIQGLGKKKGNQFFLYSTVLNEDISAGMHVEDLTLTTACEFSLNVFEASKSGDQVSDVHFYQAPDRVNHMLTLRVPGIGPSGTNVGTAGYSHVLACQDKNLRLVYGSDCLLEARTNGAATEVVEIPSKSTDSRTVLYGTSTGLVGTFSVDSTAFRAGWSLPAKKAAITALAVADVTLSGGQDVVVGRDDGTVEVFAFDGFSSASSPADPTSASSTPRPEPVFIRDLAESVTSLVCGQVLSASAADIVAHTFSGKVAAFSHELKHSTVAHIAPKVSQLKESAPPPKPQDLTNPDGTSKNVVKESKADLEKSLKELKAEVDRLNDRVGREKEKYGSRLASTASASSSSSSSGFGSGATATAADLIPLELQFRAKLSTTLLPDEAAHQLDVEIDIPLDSVLLQSQVPVMLLDPATTATAAAGAGTVNKMDGSDPVAAAADAFLSSASASGASAGRRDADKLPYLLSRNERDEKSGSELLATLRMVESANRCSLKFRTVEGQYGALNVHVVPRISPKTCQRLEVKIKPLSMHERVLRSQIESEIKSRPLNTLAISGSFTLADAHAWIAFCLPDVSAKAPTSSVGPGAAAGTGAGGEGGAAQSLCFRSTFLRTILLVEYEKGRCLFRSDNMSSISILKEVVTKEATARKIQVSVDVQLAPESLPVLLNLLRPELDAHFTLAKRQALIAPLREIATHELGGIAAGGSGGVAAAAEGSASGGGLLQHLEELQKFLQPSYVEILRDAEMIERRLKAAPRHLDFLRGIVTDLFVDKHKLQGKSAQARVPQLLEILEHYSFDKLLQAFTTKE